MKVDTEIQLTVPPDRIWKVLTDFAAYPDWNPFIKAVRGQAAPEAPLEMDMAFDQGSRIVRATEKVTVTGLNAPRYFSWVWNHGLGTWWLSAEHVFRLRERDDGRVTFFHEIFFTGFSMVKLLGFLDFRRDAMERKVKLSMIKMNEALKERVEGAPS